jgi:two-component system phosphate regulon response regulator OmpR
MSKPVRTIVVDDDQEMRSLLQRYLSGEGYSVRSVADAKALDTALQREPADIIILDLMMPGEDGLSVCRRLRATGDTTPIIMLTAKGDPIDRILGLEMGADDYLPKPFTPRELLARMSAILRRGQGASRADQSQAICFGPSHSTLKRWSSSVTAPKSNCRRGSLHSSRRSRSRRESPSAAHA